jgi:plasmid stability protein
MIFRMKTTLLIPDHLVRELKKRAAERGQTLSAVVAETLRRGLEARERGKPLRPLRTYRMGRPKVDVADRDALYREMEGS